jgi:cystathionine beta-lyase/cystathionine gamma-synthase
MELFGLRWRRHCAGGAALAELLRGQPQVREVEYSGTGGRLALRLREGADARELMLALSEFGRGRGGGVYSQAFSPALAGESEDPALLCLFAGMEEPEVLTEDVRRALARL